MLKNFIKSNYFLILILVLLSIFIVFSVNFLNPAQGSINCCYNECQPTDPVRCDGTWTQKCDKCDSDPYYDWCDQTNCAASGQICFNGACQAMGVPCAITCATGPGCRFSLANGAAVAGECCSTGDCYDCKAGWSWNGSTCVSVCADNDSDGYGNPASITCAKPQLDCDDSNANINPGETETCDSKDNDCDSAVDEGCVCVDGATQPCGTDTGQCQAGIKTCSVGVWGACAGEITPTAEICDGADNNCDGQTDEGCDNDNDDYCACGQTFAYGSNLTATCPGTNTTDATAIANTCDCKDNNAGINLAAAEICDNGLDDDCDGETDCADADCVANAACTGATTCSDNTQTNTCSTATGAPWYCDNAKNLIENCTACGCSGSWVCSLAGTFCCDNACNGSCSPAGCTVDKDPDCGCQDSNSCCGFGCDNTNDNDCATSCTENWTCAAWSACAGGVQTRTCTDSNNCGTTVNKPGEEQFCVVTEIKNPFAGDNFIQGDPIFFWANSYGGTPPYTYKWNSDKAGDFSTDQAPMINTALWPTGIHTIALTVTDSAGQTVSDSIQININPPGTLIANIQAWQTEFAKIAGFCVNASGGTAPYVYEWKSDKQGVFSNVQCPNTDVSGWAQGDHIITVKVTDSNSNTAGDTVNIKIVNMTANIFPQDGLSTEQGFNVFFNTAISGGTLPYNCNWVSDKDGNFGNSCSFVKDNLSIGVHTITVTIADSGGLSIVKTTHIQILPVTPITAVITSPADNSSIQQGNDITFSATYAGGVITNIFVWSSDRDGQISAESFFIKNNLSVGAHIITFTASDSKGNSGSASINLNITPPTPLIPVISAPHNGDSYLRFDDLVIFTGSATGGVTPYAYSWSSDKDGNLGDGNKIAKNDLSLGNHIITLKATDNAGAVASVNVNISVNTGCSSSNIKNIAKYNSEETFLISDNNWRDVLGLVPLTTWNDSGTIKKYPALIFHNEPASFDADSTIHFLQMYAPNHLTTIGSIPAGLNNLFVAASPSGAGMNAGDIANINTSDYFSYWSSFNSLIIVDYDNYKEGLMASVFASHKNSPIIFVNSANLAAYQSIINGKTIYIVGSLDAATQAYINSNAGCQVNYTLDELQKWYAAGTNSDKMILANPNDLSIELSVNFTPQKSALISHLYKNMSLAAPFLAAGREEVIAYTALNDTGANSGCGANSAIDANIATADNDALNSINNLFFNVPKYLTIIAMPRAIPDSKYNYCVTGWQLRDAFDWKYGSLTNNYFDEKLMTGRIYGLTLADISSYIALSLNYDQIFNNLYPAIYTGMSIGHSFTEAQTEAKNIKDKTSAGGYNSVCFTENFYDGCTQNKAPATNNYQNKQFITFDDHGGPTEWWTTISSSNLPWLDLPVAIGDACLTNNFWQGNQNTFGVQMIRKGTVGYYGAAGVSFTSNMAQDSIRIFTDPSTINGSLGDLVKKSIYSSVLFISGSTRTVAKSHNLLLGDPVLTPKFKQVNW